MLPRSMRIDTGSASLFGLFGYSARRKHSAAVCRAGQRDIVLLCPGGKRPADVFRPGIIAYCFRLAALFDDLIQATDDSSRR